MSIKSKDLHFIANLSDELYSDDKKIFMSSLLVMTNLPYKEPKISDWSRNNGIVRIQVSSNHFGVPYGIYPRLILSHLVTSAVNNRSPKVYLGSSFTNFLRNIGIKSHGGNQNKLIQDQMQKLLASSFSWSEIYEDDVKRSNFKISDSYKLWWPPKIVDKKQVFDQYVHLNDEFYKEITTKYIPINLNAIENFKNYPLLLDLYMFFTWRLRNIKKDIYISWENLFKQLGCQFKELKDFKKRCKKYINMIKILFPSMGVDILRGRIKLISNF